VGREPNWKWAMSIAKKRISRGCHEAFCICCRCAGFGILRRMDCGSAYQIQNGLKTKSTARIANKIDFDGVRASLRPTVEHEA
jgi:hypothetical protein